MKDKTKLILVEVAFALLALAAFLTVMSSSGCIHRKCVYDPNSGFVYYESNSFAIDSSADSISIKTTDGTLVEINKITQSANSIELIVPPYLYLKTKDN